jgi:hypothetical protein
MSFNQNIREAELFASSNDRSEQAGKFHAILQKTTPKKDPKTVPTKWHLLTKKTPKSGTVLTE